MHLEGEFSSILDGLATLSINNNAHSNIVNTTLTMCEAINSLNETHRHQFFPVHTLKELEVLNDLKIYINSKDSIERDFVNIAKYCSDSEKTNSLCNKEKEEIIQDNLGFLTLGIKDSGHLSFLMKTISNLTEEFFKCLSNEGTPYDTTASFKLREENIGNKKNMDYLDYPKHVLWHLDPNWYKDHSSINNVRIAYVPIGESTLLTKKNIDLYKTLDSNYTYSGLERYNNIIGDEFERAPSGYAVAFLKSTKGAYHAAPLESKQQRVFIAIN
ncbi:MAG: hypothetical protein N4A31_02220 [Rickettsiales bacterium]|jgi:hypothetical protein|nr:hypothetical protein [Rickettsiales bacterium]